MCDEPLILSIGSLASIAFLRKQFQGPPRQFTFRGKECPRCSHCGNLGHTVDKCYKLIGYPSSHHNKNKFPASAANVIGSGSNYTDALFELVALFMTASSTSLPFTLEQCQQLLSLLNTQFVQPKGLVISAANLVHSYNVLGGNYSLSVSFLSQTWIIDTGAFNQMINSVSLFSYDIQKCQSNVSLPDG